MFGFNNHMLEALFDIFGRIAILYGSIEYIVSVIFSKIMFDILGVKPILSLIPFYNTYRIYKEYKGRVWKRNWGGRVYNNFYYSLWYNHRCSIKFDEL